mgnify:CR=1 FL=1
MPKFRWTKEDLKTMSDLQVLRGLVAERKSELNYYTPFARRLKQIEASLEKQIEEAP